jgi:hypothetical protein
MRTQLDDLKKELKFFDNMIGVFNHNGMTRESSEVYRAYENKAMEIRSTINNIK